MDKEKLYTLILSVGLINGALRWDSLLFKNLILQILNMLRKLKILQFLTGEKYTVQLGVLQKTRNLPYRKKDKEYVLERMIEEELLIKRALDLGMLEK